MKLNENAPLVVIPTASKGSFSHSSRPSAVSEFFTLSGGVGLVVPPFMAGLSSVYGEEALRAGLHPALLPICFLGLVHRAALFVIREFNDPERTPLRVRIISTGIVLALCAASIALFESFMGAFVDDRREGPLTRAATHCSLSSDLSGSTTVWGSMRTSTRISARAGGTSRL